MERQRREQAEKDRERRQQEEKRRLLERLQRERQEEEKRQAGKYLCSHGFWLVEALMTWQSWYLLDWILLLYDYCENKLQDLKQDNVYVT